MNYSEKLRAFADYLDKRPALLERLGRWDYPSIHLYCDESNFAQTVTAIGTGEKSAYEGQITFHHSEYSKDEEEVSFYVSASIAGVCEKKETGKIRKNRIRIPADAKQDDEGNWYTETPVYEYICPPILSIGKNDGEG